MSLDGVSFLEGVSPDSSPSWRMSGRVRRLRSSARFDADAESCGSSLRELSFDSETDTTPRSSRKRLDFSASNVKADNMSSPFGGSNVAARILNADKVSSPFGSSNVAARIFNADKLSSPFGGGNVAARIPTELFYGARASPSARIAAVPVLGAKTVPRQKKRPIKKRYRLKTGVRHGIKKPKCKINVADKENALKLALQLMDDSPLNEYIAKYVRETKVENVSLSTSLPLPPKAPQAARYDTSSDSEEEYCAPRKFFKSPRGRRKCSGKDTSVDERKRKNTQHVVNEIIEDDEEIHFAQEKCDINKLLDQWVEEDVPESEPRIHHADLETVPANYYKNNSQAVAESQFMQVDSGYVFVNSENIDEEITNDFENIDTQIELLDKQISEIAKNNNLNPNLFLNPRDSNLSGIEQSPDIIVPHEQSTTITSSSPQNVLFPLFSKNYSTEKKGNVCRNQGAKNSNKKKISTDDKQYMIDAGQKHFGATQCKECGVIYEIGNGADEADHMLYHDSLDVLKFNGWKNEKFCGQLGEGRVIVVSPGDPPSHWERVHNLLNRVVHPQLGFAAPLKPERVYKAFIFIEKKLITGCLIAEPLQKAHKLIEHKSVDCCSRRVYPVKCGVSRLWTHKSHRKKGIATKLLNAMRTNFMFGHILACDEIAFSSPTPLGKCFIEKYCQASDFKVYLD